jgi:hypothetical protein
MAKSEFQPREIEHHEMIGSILSINAIQATVPDQLLPDRVTLRSSWRSLGGTKTRHWYAQHNSGQITLPPIPGDGEEDLRQLIDWLKRNGYRDETPGLGDPMEFARHR